MSDDPPEQIAPEHRLGRRESSGTRAKKGRSRVNDFLPRKDECDLSVDRLGFAPKEKMVEVVRQTSGPEQPFHGWHVLTAAAVEQAGCRVVASPIRPCNPYHADIVLPVACLPTGPERKKVERKCAQDLSLKTKFCAAC